MGMITLAKEPKYANLLRGEGGPNVRFSFAAVLDVLVFSFVNGFVSVIHIYMLQQMRGAIFLSLNLVR